MFVELAIVFILGLTVYLSLKCCILPKRKYEKYLESLTKLGYEVHSIPFKPFRIPFVQIEQQSLIKHNDSCYLTKKMAPNCDVILTNASSKILLIITSPKLMKDYFSGEKVDQMSKTKLITFGLSTFAGKGLFLSQGNEWRTKRKILSKVFTFDLIKANISQIAQIANSTLEAYEGEKKEIDEQAIRIFSNFTNRVVLKCFFGEKDFNEQVNDVPFSKVIIQMIEESVKIAFSPAVLIFGQRAIKWGLTKKIRDFNQTISIFNNICRGLVQRRTEQIKQKLAENQCKLAMCNDLLQALLVQKNRCALSNQQFVYSEQDIVQQFATFIAAGTDTTSNFISLMIYYICSNPRIEAKLRSQLQEYIKTDEDFNFEVLKKLGYLQCVQKETSRFYGPATILVPKVIQQDTYFSDVPVSKGTLLTINLFGCHYREEFFKNPYEFRPQRWQQMSEASSGNSFIAFGGGPRGCIGKQLANLQSKIVVAKIFKQYRQIIVPKEIKLIDGFVYFAQKLRVKFIK